MEEDECNPIYFEKGKNEHVSLRNLLGRNKSINMYCKRAIGLSLGTFLLE